MEKWRYSCLLKTLKITLQQQLLPDKYPVLLLGIFEKKITNYSIDEYIYLS